MQDAREALIEGDRKQITDTRRLDDVLDHLNTAIKAYLTSLDPDDLSVADHGRLNEILTFAMDIEQAGDVVDLNLLPHASKRLKRGLKFSREGEAELSNMMDRLVTNLRAAASLFMTGDLRAARLLAEEKAAFRDVEAVATRAHFERMRSGRVDLLRRFRPFANPGSSRESGFVQSDFSRFGNPPQSQPLGALILLQL